jgi:ABC-type ATPase involved in cell division
MTLFIGTQGSGKSTIAKLLTFCRESLWADVRDKLNYTKRLHDYGINDYLQENSFIFYELKYDETTIPCKVTYEDGHFLVEMGDNQSADIQRFLYVPAERNLIGNMSEAIASMWSAQIPISSLLLNYMSQFERATKELPVYDIPFFDVSYVKQDNRNMISLKGKNKLLPLSVSSSGLQSAIPMLVIIDYAIKTDAFNSFVIEEPEQNLFPENQREILNFISSRIAGKDDRQVVLTTHSPYMLSCLNVLMLAYKMHNHEEFREKVEEIVNPDCMVNPADVAAYSLNPNDEDGIYCKSLISEKTGMVSVNELDTASMFIGEDFDKLYRMFVKSIKSKNK